MRRKRRRTVLGGMDNNPHLYKRSMFGMMRITKRTFYDTGGFSNGLNVRVQRGHAWAYYRNFA